MWIDRRCDGLKRVTAELSQKIYGRKCGRNIGEAVEQEEKSCVEVETVKVFTYLGDRVSTSGECEVAVIARTRCWWVRFWECGELLYGLSLSWSF